MENLLSPPLVPLWASTVGLISSGPRLFTAKTTVKRDKYFNGGRRCREPVSAARWDWDRTNITVGSRSSLTAAPAV